MNTSVRGTIPFLYNITTIVPLRKRTCEKLSFFHTPFLVRKLYCILEKFILDLFPSVGQPMINTAIVRHEIGIVNFKLKAVCFLIWISTVL